MNRRHAVLALTVAAASSHPLYAAPSWWERLTKGRKSSSDDESSGDAPLTDNDIGAGLREALRLGATRAVDGLAVEDGFFGNPEVKIPLPASLDKVRSTLDRFGLSGKFDELELQLNRAAEVAAPAARTLFVDAITNLTLSDVRGILNGGDSAATEFLRAKTAEPLGVQMTPAVESSLAKVGAARTYASVIDRYNQVPFVPKVEANLSSYVVDRGLAGIFTMLGKEEAAIRANPLEQSSKLLRRVFG